MLAELSLCSASLLYYDIFGLVLFSWAASGNAHAEDSAASATYSIATDLINCTRARYFYVLLQSPEQFTELYNVFSNSFNIAVDRGSLSLVSSLGTLHSLLRSTYSKHSLDMTLALSLLRNAL